MPVISFVEDPDRLRELKEIMKDAERKGAPDPNLYRVLAHNPAIAKTFAAQWDAVLYEGVLDHKLKELVRIRVNQLHNCPYCTVVRSNKARELGLDEEKIKALDNYESDPSFTEKERVALRFAEGFVVGKYDYDLLKKYFTEPEIVELLWLIGICDGIGKVVASWQIPKCTTPVEELIPKE